MDNAAIIKLLESLQEQSYPLTVDEETANALVACIRRIMASVPEDDQIIVRGDYNLATSALCHPEPNDHLSTTNGNVAKIIRSHDAD